MGRVIRKNSVCKFEGTLSNWTDEKSPDRQFQWGGRVGIFFRGEGIYIFGDTNRLRILGYTLGLLGVVFASYQLIPSFNLTFEEAVAILLVEAVLGLALWTFFIFKKYSSKKARSQFSLDLNFDDLMNSNARRTFYPWSQVWFAKFDGTILNYRAGSKLLGVRGFMGCTPEQTAQLQMFLSDKLGERFKQ